MRSGAVARCESPRWPCRQREEWMGSYFERGELQPFQSGEAAYRGRRRQQPGVSSAGGVTGQMAAHQWGRVGAQCGGRAEVSS
jgi:hypothetical protein